MLKAVNLGDDTYTVAAIAGGLAGLYYGYEDIPKDWLAVIKKRKWIEGMCEGLEITTHLPKHLPSLIQEERHRT